MSSTKSSIFYWSDWRNDPGLRLCSYAARGLWMDMLTLAAEADPRGYVLIAGRPPTAAELAKATGGDPAEVERLLAELEHNRVFSRTKARVIYSRRMVKDENLRRKSVENGKMGGNPSLRKSREKSQGVNPPENPPLVLPLPYPSSPNGEDPRDPTLPPSSDSLARAPDRPPDGGLGGGVQGQDQDFEDLVAGVFRAAGFDPLRRSARTDAHIARWASALPHAAILRVIDERSRAMRSTGDPPRTLRAFDDGIARAIEARARDGPPAAAVIDIASIVAAAVKRQG